MSDYLDLDVRIRALHTAPLAGSDTQTSEAEERALNAALARVHTHGRRGAPFSPRMWRVMVVATLAGAALFTAAALAPWGGDGDPGARQIPGLADTASAEEALGWAGDALVASGGAAGSGATWHGTASAYLDGELTTVTEQWFDPASKTYRAAAWGLQKTEEEPLELLKVVSIDEAGTASLRAYEKPAIEDWRVPDEIPGPHTVYELPKGYGVRQRVLATATQAWLTAVDGNPGRPAIVAATERFSAATQKSYFGGEAPEMSRAAVDGVAGGGAGDAEAQAAVREEIDAGKIALRIRPVLFLLTTVQATPQATRVLYEEIAQLDTLQRLPNVTVDGREAIRIRFDPVDFGTHRERVLVIDGLTGAPIRTESTNRTAWTEFEPARRVLKTGDEPGMCPERVPCELLRGEGPAARGWDEYLASPSARIATQMFKDPSFAFITATELRPADSGDSVYGTFTGECSRDARTLAICRG